MDAISIPGVLHRRLAMIAHQHGETVELLVRRALEQYLAALEAPKRERETEDRAAFMDLLHSARTEYETSGEPWLGWEEIEREVADRRGGHRWEEV